MHVNIWYLQLWPWQGYIRWENLRIHVCGARTCPTAPPFIAADCHITGDHSCCSCVAHVFKACIGGKLHCSFGYPCLADPQRFFACFQTWTELLKWFSRSGRSVVWFSTCQRQQGVAAMGTSPKPRRGKRYRQRKLVKYARIRINIWRRVENLNFRWANRPGEGLAFLCIAAAPEAAQGLKNHLRNMCFTKPMCGSKLPRKVRETSGSTDRRKGLLRVIGQWICHETFCPNL